MLKKWIASTAVLAASVTGIGAAAASASASTCPSGSYPSYVNGRPSDAKAGMTGMAVWRDTHGWHLRVSEAGKDRAVFTGEIRTDGDIKDVARRVERRDAVLHVGKHVVAYRFTNYGGVDGIDFVVPCSSTVKFVVAMNGHRLPSDEILLGADNTHPSSNPFSISKAA
jgi:hypothetical protein